MINCQSLSFVYETEFRRYRHVAAGSNRKSKIDTKSGLTKFWRRASFVCIIYDIVRGYISTMKHIIGEVLRALGPPRVRWCSGHTTCNTLKRKSSGISRRLHPVKFFLHVSCEQNDENILTHYFPEAFKFPESHETL